MSEPNNAALMLLWQDSTDRALPAKLYPALKRFKERIGGKPSILVVSSKDYPDTKALPIAIMGMEVLIAGNVPTKHFILAKGEAFDFWYPEGMPDTAIVVEQQIIDDCLANGFCTEIVQRATDWLVEYGPFSNRMAMLSNANTAAAQAVVDLLKTLPSDFEEEEI